MQTDMLKAPMREQWGLLVALGILLLFAAVALGDMLSPPLRIAVDSLVSACTAVTVAGLAFRAAWAQSASMLRASWVCFGAALLAWGFGDALRGWWALTNSVPAASPTLVDLAKDGHAREASILRVSGNPLGLADMAKGGGLTRWGTEVLWGGRGRCL